VGASSKADLTRGGAQPSSEADLARGCDWPSSEADLARGGDRAECLGGPLGPPGLRLCLCMIWGREFVCVCVFYEMRWVFPGCLGDPMTVPDTHYKYENNVTVYKKARY
jgi:hypothetical protein